MIEEDNSGDTNKLCLLLQEMDTVHLENCKMGWEAGSSHRIKKKEQGSKHGAQSRLGVWGLAD